MNNVNNIYFMSNKYCKNNKLTTYSNQSSLVV